MKSIKPSALFLTLFTLPACGQQLVEFPNHDGSTRDAGKADVVLPDAVRLDVPARDVAVSDTRFADSRGVDAVDAAPPDAPTPSMDNAPGRDLGFSDTVSGEAGLGDVGRPDTAEAGPADVARPDTGEIDGASSDGLNVDARENDAANEDAASREAGGIDGSGPPAIVVKLGRAAPFAIAATEGVTNTSTSPITQINGDVVLTPNQTCNAVQVDNEGGFGLCDGMPPTISGVVLTSVYPDTTEAAAIKADLNAAFLNISPLAGPPAIGSLGGGTALAAPTTLGNVAGSPLVLGDNWFPPGVYTSTTSILLTGDVTLDGQGDPNAVFVFQSASSLTTADGAASPGAHVRVLLINGAKASNVWWQVASSATLGTQTEFQGNILAAFDITMKTGAQVCGRSMAGAWAGGEGAFVFDANVVSVPGNGCPL